MAHPSSNHGQPSPPHSNQEDYPLSEYGHSPMPPQPVQRPYTPPTSYPAQQYVSNYSDPEEHQMQYTQEYNDSPAFYREATYRTPPRQITNDGIQTRSGRSLGTPMTASSPSSRMSASPRPRKKKGKDKGMVYQIEEPLSVMTREYDVPVEDMNVWCNRPDADRYAEVNGKQKGKIPRPMNSFMLYRRAYKERIKKWGQQGDNNQLISSVAGLSWNLEPEDIKAEYARLAIVERDNHAKAFPDYKFAPNKNTKKRGRDEDDDSDGEWEGGSSYSGKRRRGRHDRDVTRSRSSTPAQVVYGTPQYHPSSYQANNPHLMPPLAYNHWPHAAVQYDQSYQYEQPLTYHPQPHAIQYAPTSMPAQYTQYDSQLVSIPPTTEGMMQGELVAGPDYGIDPNLADYAPTANYQYGGSFVEEDRSRIVRNSQNMYEEEEPAIHPGLQTLAPAEPMWSPEAQGNVGSAFDAEFNRFNQEQ
ncbi:hypothetical protein PMZ80_001272 [Knufia obscura]|uniref:HMG box domain-containing protein n=1 Tax=Knufia obscura TaxID=1635080 RepID=A0ABR0S2Q9_9EURO|nr:hypothetical protein PMZ80_001272 [Knufia obscura]